MSVLFGMHDREGRGILPAGGWCVDTLALAENPAPTNYAALRADINWIVRLNWGYGTTGTIPLPHEYQRMATAAADYVARSSGANIWIIGNEPNHENERPNNVYITPQDYARCFVMCRDAIRQANTGARVVPAACAPYHAEPADWLVYWRTMLDEIEAQGGCDGLCVHAYTRSSNPADITSEAKMGEPLEEQYSGFYTFIDALDVVPKSMWSLPAYLTEFNELLPDGWDNANTGLVQAAYKEIDRWNDGDVPKIQCLALYRWPAYDKWYIEGKQGVIDDFRAAVQLGYESPLPSPIPEPPMPQPEPPTPPQPQGDDFLTEWDSRLDQRGCTLTVAAGANDGAAWRVRVGRWYNEQQAQGRVNCYITVLDEQGQLLTGVPVRWFWSSGDEVKPTEIKSDPFLGGMYSIDFSMYNPAPSYGFEIADGVPSDMIYGLGLGSIEQPDYKIHTCYYFEVQRLANVTPEPPEPEPTPPEQVGALLWPVVGPITDYFGTPPPIFGQAGHGGIDIACPLNTPVLCVYDGEVMYSGWDDDYGNYVRVWHPALHFHSFYAHLGSVHFDAGQQVGRGQQIALSGSTGNSTGPHLHLEFRGGTRDGYYTVTYGYNRGRFDPRTIYLVTGAPLDPGAGL